MKTKCGCVDTGQFLQLFNSGALLNEIGTELNVSQRTLSRIVKQLGLNAKTRPKFKVAKPSLTRQVGKKYAYLTVVGTEYNSRLHQWVLTIKCDCGRISTETAPKLVNGDRKSCGVIGCSYRGVVRQENGKKAGWTGCGEIYGCRWDQWRIGAEKRGLAFDISIEYAWELFEKQGRKCALTGEPISFGNSWNRKCTASLDRIDSAKPYIEGNVQWVQTRVNLMKRSMDEAEFIELCGLIWKNRS